MLQSTVADAAVHLLGTAGVRRVYSVPGESFLPLLDVLERDRTISLISARHESGASFMAEADAKLCGTPAVALGSRGPGAANLTIGVHTAFQDETPMLVILGQVRSSLRGRESFQEVDLAAFFSPIAKWAREAATPEEVPRLLGEALHSATTGRRGPAVLAVPTDFWTARYSEPLPSAELYDPVFEADVRAAASTVMQIFGEAEKPVVIVGGGAAHAGDDLVPALEKLAVPVYNAFRRQGVFPEDHPQYAGHLGLGVPKVLLQPLDEADVILALGTRMDEVTSQGFRYPLPGQRLVIVGSGSSTYKTRGITVSIDVPVGSLLRALPETPSMKPYDCSAAHAAVERHSTVAESASTDGINPATVIRALRRMVPPDAIVTNDAGNFSGFLHRFWTFSSGMRQLAPANGAMGYAVPSAVAAKLAAPHRTVIAMVGDGGILMTGQEIETAVRYGAAVVVIVFQNGLYGTIAMHQAKTYGRLAGVTIGELDLASWARGLGATGYTVDRETDLQAALENALSSGRPSVIDVRTDPDLISTDATLSGLLGQGASDAANVVQGRGSLDD